MLDPLAALSAAGNIVQFVDLGYKILSNSFEIYKSGTTEGNTQLQTVTDDLVALSQRITDAASTQLTVTTVSTNAISAEDANSIQVVAEQTSVVSKELLDALKKIHVTGKHNKVRSLRQALRNVLSEDKINEIGRKLENLRSELNLRVLVSLKNSSAAQSVRQDARLENLGADLQNIIRDILDGKAEILGRIDQSTTILFQQQQENHEELMNALSTLSITDMASAQRPQPTYPLDLSPSQRTMVEDIILEQLKYRSIGHREYEIESPHEETFQWILSDTSPMHEGGASLVSWLLNGSGVYWIRGKAASGKSTLMKLIAGSPKTREMLTKWAGENQLLTASFYFWNIGTTEQRSQSGLLRSLLLSLLQENRPLIQQTMSEIYGEISQGFRSSSYPQRTNPPSDVEVKVGFLRLVQNLPPAARVCLFIDGLDEYEGDVPDLLKLLLATASKKFKMVVSSRPIPSCVTTLKNFPHLRLELLTRPDILRYTERSLLPHPNAKHLLQEDSNAVTQLVQEVANRSDGVFLWVTLVVKLLLKALDKNDSTGELRELLDTLPRDLELLYKHMMDQMTESHRKIASWYLQMTLRSIEVQKELQLNLVQCWLAERYSENSSAALIRANGDSGRTPVWNDRNEWMEGRLIGVCCGLIEVVNISASPWEDEIPTVTFIHKSVADFLRQPDTWDYITNLNNDKQSNMYHILATSSLAYMKNVWISELSSDRFRLLYTDYCLAYLRAAETSEQAAMLETLHDLRAYLVKTLGTRDIREDYDRGSCSKPRRYLLDKVDLRGLPDFRADFYVAAYGLLPLHFQQLHAAYRTQDGYQCSKDESRLLCSLITENWLVQTKIRDCLPELMQIIEYLFQQGVDVNTKEFEGRSAWHHLLLELQLSYRYSASETAFYLNLIPLFVQNGASWQKKDIVPSVSRKASPHRTSAREIVEALDLDPDDEPYSKNSEIRADLKKKRPLLLAEMNELDSRKNKQVRLNKFKKSSFGKLLSKLSKKT